MTVLGPGEEERIRIDETAARLLVQYDLDPSPARQAELYRWIEERDAHAVAFARAQAAWRNSERLKILVNADGQEAIAEPQAEPLQVESAPASRSRRNILAGLAAAASVAAIMPFVSSDLFGWQDYDTKVGERRTMRLADGSMVHLNTASRLAAKLAADRRHIRLYEGEASFDVAHDKSRPFEVEANGSIVRAVGTSFNVRLAGTAVVLTVTEGVVAITQPGKAARFLESGRSAVIRPDALTARQLSEAEMSQRMAWHRDMIELNGDTVEQAVAEFNRYLDKPIIVGDRQVGSLHIGGRFNTRDADLFLVALEHSLPVKVVKNADGSVVLLHANGA